MLVEETLPEAPNASNGGARKVLMIARSFPPFRSVGGSIRVVKFIKYLPALGWLPAVVTIDDRKEYETTRKIGSASLLQDIPPQVRVYRTAAGEPSLDTLELERSIGRKNRLAGLLVSILGATRRWALRTLFLPDRYIAWMPFALMQGRGIMGKEAINVIFATCPPHSAALIGALLKRLTGKPLVLDFRDDWIDTPWHGSRPTIIRLIERRLERWAVANANKVILVTEWSRNAFLARYPAEPEGKFVFIPNGCDLEDFAARRQVPDLSRRSNFTIVHAGLLNDSQAWTRSPSAFFQALVRIQQDQPELATGLTVAFTGRLPEGYRHLVGEWGLSAIVKELGHLPRTEYVHALQSADLLLAINFDGFSTLVPGKIYEYWAAGGPPILLLSCLGAARDLVERHQLGIAVTPHDVEGIQQALLAVYRRREMGDPMRVNMSGIEKYDRKALASKLAQILSEVDLSETARA